MIIAIVGPHGSGNRLVRRLVDHSFPEAECGVRSFPIGTRSKPPARNWNPDYLLRPNLIPEYHLVTMRDLSPYCMVRERRQGATSVDEAFKLWRQAYRQIYESIGPFWDREDTRLIRYRDFFDHGPGFVVDQISEMLGVAPAGFPFDEPIVDGDTKYESQLLEPINPRTADEWVTAIKHFCGA